MSDPQSAEELFAPAQPAPCDCSDIQPWAVYAAMGVGVAIGAAAFFILARGKALSGGS